ncbi:hypothetical protein Tco_0907056 [Tanacetum coccineum]|uniref:Uncharacterized protein n=1 Tax=Tanacetum coccineum TaxID=301880 RepID=A0ABQ5CI75_9ASTR
MALPPRAQRQQYLRFEGLEYTNVDIADFEERLGKIYGRGMPRDRVCLLDEFGGGYLRFEARCPGTREADDVVGALEVAKGAPDIDEGAQAVPAPIQAPQPPPATGPARTLSQKVARLSGVRYTSYFDFRIPYQRRVRCRTGEGSTSAVPLDEDQPDP